MRHLRYTNAVLTVLAILLSLQLWTTWTACPDSLPRVHAVGIPDEGAQREQMIGLLKLLNQKVDEFKAFMESGKLTVNVAGATGADAKKE